ncbi:MAG: response regulator [Myxococcales bacterium]|nr:response regulator [Myxococcales bacterium]
MSAKRIVAIDDEPHILRILELKLRNAGYDVVTAINGRDGVEKIAATSPDIVISDVNMPEMGGLELLTAIQELRGERDFLVIMLTAQTEAEVRAFIDTIPNTELMSKPFSPRKILERVDAWFTRAAA